MNEYDFLYAVGRIREIESGLLDAAAVERILSSDFDEALKLLHDMGWAGESMPYEQILQNRLAKSWELLESINPNKGCLDFLIIKNDFHNLKTAVKAYISKSECDGLLLSPGVYNPEEIKNCVFAKDFDALPELMRDAANRCYKELVTNSDPQMADVIADSAALACMREMAVKTGEEFLRDIAELIVASANIKTAARAARTKRGRGFLQEAIVPCATLDKEKLIEASLNSFDAVLEYLNVTDKYREAAKMLGESMSAFEKWSDDALMKLVSPAKHIAFGVAPLAAHYIAVETEVKILRIVLSCKQNRVDDGMIRERMRLLYV